MIEIRKRAQRPNTGFCEGYMIPVNPLTTQLPPPIAHYHNHYFVTRYCESWESFNDHHQSCESLDFARPLNLIIFASF